MQKAYIGALYELAKSDRNVISVLSDSGTEYDELFAREMPDQVLNFGIAEGNQVGAAAGLAKWGKVPFVYTSGAFLAFRAFEFIRDDICLQGRNVKVVGMGSGISWSTLGPTHHTTEDVAVLRSLPNLTLLSPATPAEARRAVLDAYAVDGPVYLRLGMGGEPELWKTEVPSLLDEPCCVMREGSDATVLATGPVLCEVLLAAEKLAEEGISLRVVNVRRLSPLSASEVAPLIVGSACITVEEHVVAGGLGGIVAEALAEKGCSARLERIGLDGTFAKGYGTYEQVRKANGLDAIAIASRVREVVA